MKILTDELYSTTDLTKRPYILFFTTKNCPNCKIVEEYLIKIENDKLKPCYFDIYKISSHENKILTEIFLTNNGIRAFPTTFFIKNGKATTIIGSKKIGEFIINVKNICKGEKQTLRLKLKKLKDLIFEDGDEK